MKREVKAFRSERVIVTVHLGEQRYKVFQVFFGRDGSLFVSFPYFRHREGILAAGTIPGNGKTETQVSLEKGGMVASHDVKYAHHVDGEAHFSQTGRVFTKIRRKSVSLDKQHGHIFTVDLQGLSGFDKADDRKDVGVSPKRAVIGFAVDPDEKDRTIHIVGRWFDIDAMQWSGDETVVGPKMLAQDDDGLFREGLIVASPFTSARHVLFLICRTVPRLDQAPEKLLFFGGYAPREVMDDVKQDAGFLTFMYPVAEFEKLKEKIGCVDFTLAK